MPLPRRLKDGPTSRLRRRRPRGDLDAAATALAARLSVEADPNVRAVIGESLGRLPYVTADQVENVKRTLLGLLARSQSAADRLGVASGLEEVVRLDRTLSPMDAAVGALRTLRLFNPAGADPLAAGPDARRPGGCRIRHAMRASVAWPCRH